MVTLDKKLTTKFLHGRKSGIGLTPVKLSESTALVRQGILVKADSINGGKVYVGSIPDVTAGSNDLTDGFELAKPGDSVTVEVDSPSKVILVSDTVDQGVFWVGV